MFKVQKDMQQKIYNAGHPKINLNTENKWPYMGKDIKSLNQLNV